MDEFSILKMLFEIVLIVIVISCIWSEGWIDLEEENLFNF